MPVRAASPLWRERIDYSAHGSSCALDHTVADVLGGVHRALRHVFRCSHRSGLGRANGNGEGEYYRKQRFHSTKYSFLTARMRLPDRQCELDVKNKPTAWRPRKLSGLGPPGFEPGTKGL